jgi:hypothetical protein
LEESEPCQTGPKLENTWSLGPNNIERGKEPLTGWS